MLSVVADLGGTNIRLAVCELETGILSEVKQFACAEFASIEAALGHYFASLAAPVAHLCVAIACPVDHDWVEMTNLSWAFSQQALKQAFNLDTLAIINDYTAISLAVPFLSPQEKVQIGGGEIQEGGVTAVFGPGTGLGVAHIIKPEHKWISLDGEGGHCSFTPTTREQADILFVLQEQFGHVSAERILSGPGLVNIYQSLCYLGDQPALFTLPKQVSQAALDGSCPLARRSLELFCEVMGSFAGNLALTLNCTGGVYIAGGIVPRFIEFFQRSAFRAFFQEKGRFSDYLSTIPTFVICNDNPGLLGASVYLRQELTANC